MEEWNTVICTRAGNAYEAAPVTGCQANMIFYVVHTIIMSHLYNPLIHDTNKSAYCRNDRSSKSYNDRLSCNDK